MKKSHPIFRTVAICFLLFSFFVMSAFGQEGDSAAKAQDAAPKEAAAEQAKTEEKPAGEITKNFRDWIAVSASLLAFIISTVFLLINFRYNSQLQHNRFFLELNQRFVDDYKLSALFNSDPIWQDESMKEELMQPENMQKRKALGYFVLYSFDSIHNYYRMGLSLGIRRNAWKTWNCYFTKLYFNSDYFKAAVDNAISNSNFNHKFVDVLLEIRDEDNNKECLKLVAQAEERAAKAGLKNGGGSNKVQVPRPDSRP
jgi:hypothetical protein